MQEALFPLGAKIMHAPEVLGIYIYYYILVYKRQSQIRSNKRLYQQMMSRFQVSQSRPPPRSCVGISITKNEAVDRL